jgi:hypothetical protein
MSKSKAKARATPTSAPRSTLLRVTVLGWSAATIGALLILHATGVPLGQGSFVYRFSELQAIRARHAGPILLITLLLLVSVWLQGQTARARHTLGGAGLIISTAALAAWVWGAPPQAMSQHMFNLLSPSHEGAFLIELDDMQRSDQTIGEYLREFDQRIERSPKELLGTRVISNPPGITVLFDAIARLFPPQVDPPGWAERMLVERFGASPEDLPRTMRTLQFALAMLLMWALAAPLLYALGRMFLPPAGAAAFMLIAWFNPSTVHFSPGKDPAQLLTISLMLLLWLAAWKRDRPWLAALAGAVLMIGMATGLIHLWIAAALLLATAWDDWRLGRMSGRWVMRLILPAAGGAIAIVLGIYFASGWNTLGTFFAVSRRFGEIQRGLALSHTIWFFIGLPIFLLFASPGLAAFVALTARRLFLRRAMFVVRGSVFDSFGVRLTISTLLVMFLSYITGVSYELPRLWVAFLPSLTLGVMIASPLALATHGRAMRALLFILAAQLIITATHWTQLDVRESEFRLTQGRFFTMTRPSGTTAAPAAPSSL